MTSQFTWSAVLALLGLSATSAFAGPITFAAADYDNNAVQTSGMFRDVNDGSRISRGGNLVDGVASGPYTSLNFTGSDNNAAYRGATTIYDTNVADGLPTLFTGNISMFADILIDPFNNAKGAGMVFLFNEGPGDQGLALYLWDGGNTDSYAVNFVHQDGVTRQGNVAATQSLGANIPEDQWFRLNLDLLFTSPTNFTATGSVFRHVTATNPTSALGAQVGSNLVYSSSLSNALRNPYEIGLVGRGDGGVEGASVTNFSVTPSLAAVQAVPEPGTVFLLGSGVVGLAWSARKRMQKR